MSKQRQHPQKSRIGRLSERIVASRLDRRSRRAEQAHALWEERRYQARRQPRSTSERGR